jgi:circadian clock protein KaiC
VAERKRASTGISGLDEILGGGLPNNRVYLIQGDPGVGKTTLAMQFLMAGAQAGERCLYITLSETLAEIRDVADSHGWSLEGIEVVELSAIEQVNALDDNTLFETSEVELHETTRKLLGFVEKVQPSRVVFDSLSELRLLAQSSLRYRRQILSLKSYFVEKECTVMMLDDRTSEGEDPQLQSLAHGVVMLEQVTPIHGEDRRQIRVQKLRGVKFRGGRHDFSICTGGIQVYPRLKVSDHPQNFDAGVLSSGLPELDALIGGGLDRGTSTLLIGPAGSGKSAVASQYAVAASRRGEYAAIFAFDERVGTLLARSRSLGLDLEAQVSAGRMKLRQVEPSDLSPGEFATLVRKAVEEEHATVIVIDSLNGYLQTMPDERLLLIQLHELLGYLAHKGVCTILVMAQHGLIGRMESPTDVSYVADTVLLHRYFEAQGRIRKAISCVKKRSGQHENTIRELVFSANGVTVGEPLVDFHGVLTGVPRFMGKLGDLDPR